MRFGAGCWDFPLQQGLSASPAATIRCPLVRAAPSPSRRLRPFVRSVFNLWDLVSGAQVVVTSFVFQCWGGELGFGQYFVLDCQDFKDCLQRV